jgi:putative tricarboxylic transport membrane protein
MWRVSGRAGDLATAAVLAGLGALWIGMAVGMPKGEFAVPGPGFFPGLLGGGLVGAAAWLTWRALRTAPGAQEVALGHPDIWAALLAILLLAPLFERLGFIVSIALFVGVLLWRLTSLRWWSVLVAAAASSLAAYGFFSNLLGLRLPAFPGF